MQIAFTPTINFANSGDLTVSYSVQSGVYEEIGDLVFVQMFLGFTPTFTNASGQMRIENLPEISLDSYFTLPISVAQTFEFPEGTTMLAAATIAGEDYATIVASGSGKVAANLSANELLSGGNYYLVCSGFYPKQ